MTGFWAQSWLLGAEEDFWRVPPAALVAVLLLVGVAALEFLWRIGLVLGHHTWAEEQRLWFLRFLREDVALAFALRRRRQ